jgi:CBS domain-containing protein
MGTDHVDPGAELETPVRELMISRPKSLDRDALVGDARRLFENASVRVAMVVEGGRYAGELRREDVPATAADGEPLSAYVRQGESIRPEAPLAEALSSLERTGGDRLAVVEDERLVGLVCFSRSHGRLCVDPRR